MKSISRPISVCYYCKNLLVSSETCRSGAEKLSKSLNGECDGIPEKANAPKDFRTEFLKNVAIQKYKKGLRDQSIQTVEEMYGGMTR